MSSGVLCIHLSPETSSSLIPHQTPDHPFTPPQCPGLSPPMVRPCLQCGQPTEWSPDVGSAVCTVCGTLDDPSQSVLTSHFDFPNDSTARDFSSLASSRPATLKSLRGNAGWHLAGQGKEARHERNKLALHESIRVLATRLGHPGIARRAQALFDLIMLRGALRWGRAAKLAAAAASLFALREAGRGDLTPDIARVEVIFLFLPRIPPTNCVARSQFLFQILFLAPAYTHAKVGSRWMPAASRRVDARSKREVVMPDDPSHTFGKRNCGHTLFRPSQWSISKAGTRSDPFLSFDPILSLPLDRVNRSILTRYPPTQYLLSEPAPALARALGRLLRVLDLTLPRTLPTAHFPMLTTHLTTLTSADPPTLPPDLLVFLRPLVSSHIPAVLHTAEGLYHLLTMPSEDSEAKEEDDSVLHSPTALAPALFVLALEAHAMPHPRSAPHVQDLAAQLGARLGVAGGTVMKRYRKLVDLVEKGAKGLPWLGSGGDAKGKGKGKKMGKRTEVARAVVD
ncbi:hypothetical protein EW146_g9623, partial [Bondarzewia mesenterica]